jgi:sigma-B regulation protein RsbU (phosphoserine phosphatase)
MVLFRPAIALMNRLKYPQKFLLISLVFILPLALVMNFLITELDSRIEFTQKEIYGNIYLRPINQLWQIIPVRQITLQQQFYKDSLSLGKISHTEELSKIESKITEEFAKLTEIDEQLGRILKTDNKLEEIKFRWQSVLGSQEFLGFRNHDLLLEEIDLFRRHIVDFSNLILDPDLDTYYLMDAIAFKLPEMQKLLYKMRRTHSEIIFKQEISNENKALLISLVSLLSDFNKDLGNNLDRAFSNNLENQLRQNLGISLRNFLISISEINSYSSQLATQNNANLFNDSFFNVEVESALESSFKFWNDVSVNLNTLLERRMRGFQERKQFIVIFVAVILVTVIYLFVGFYLSVMRTVQQLDMAAKQMTGGDTALIRLDSKDELSMVVRAFNSVAAALRESEQKYRGIFENSVDGIFQTSVDGRYISVNPALAEIYGYDSVEQMLSTVVDIASDVYVDRDRRRQFQKLMEVNDTLTDFESEVYKRDRSTIWISENVRAFRDQDGKIIYYEGTVEDITQRKDAEIALEIANHHIIALNNRLKEENLRMSGELEVTRRLQQMILPKEQELSEILGLEIAGFMEPADEVGGDYYDVLQQNGKIKIGIGDVTGHGLESGMLMIMVQTAVRTLLQNEENDPVRFLDTLNRTIYGNVQRMASSKNLSLALLDYEHGLLTLSGQHEEMIIVRQNGELERFDTIDLGFPIGLEEEIGDFLDKKEMRLYAGDVVVLYTDGISEAENEQRQMYGVDRLCEVICANASRSAHDIRQAVIDDLRSHIGSQKVYDDITLLVIKQK